MRVLGVLVAWGVLAVLATMCFAVGGSIGYRRGVRDTLAQIRDRRTGKTGCRPLPANHLRRRTSAHARPGARARRARWHVGSGASRRTAVGRDTARLGRSPTVAAASLAVVLLIGIPGTAIGATTAQPGESLWKVKLGLERVRLALATTPESDAEVHVDLASARLSELAGLVAGDPAPAVIGDVSDDLGGHALAASEQLGDVRTDAVRTELQRRILDLTEQQVRVMKSKLDEDCTQDPDLDCAALTQTHDDMVALQESADDTIAMAGTVQTDVATASPSAPSRVLAEITSPTPDEQDTQPVPAAATGDVIADDAPPQAAAQPDPAPAPAASSTPSVSASTTPSAAPSPNPSPTASPAPPPAGSPATEATVEPSTDEKTGAGAAGSPAADDAAANAAGAGTE